MLEDRKAAPKRRAGCTVGSRFTTGLVSQLSLASLRLKKISLHKCLKIGKPRRNAERHAQ